MSKIDLLTLKPLLNVSQLAMSVIALAAPVLIAIQPANSQQAEIKVRQLKNENPSHPILIIDSNKDGQPDGLTIANLKGLTPEEGNALMRLLLEEWTKGTICEQSSGDMARFIRMVEDFFGIEHSGYNTNFNTEKSLGSVSVEGLCTPEKMKEILGGEMLNLKKITSHGVKYYVLQQGGRELGRDRYTMFSEKQILDMVNRLREQQVL